MNTSIRTLIIDDETLAREELIRMLKDYPEIECIGQAAGADEALTLIEELNPDLIFLDINMPEKSGFDLLQELIHTPYVVFATAYDSFALKAFDMNAIDYIVKPISKGRLEQTVLKVIQQIEKDAATAVKQAQNAPQKHLFIKDGDTCHFVKLKDIQYIRSVGNYCEVYFGKDKAFIRKSLNQMQDRLPEDVFFRANRKEIINIDHVSEVDMTLRNVIQLTMNMGKSVELSSRQTIRFKELMS